MKEVFKPFNKELHDKVDPPARKAVSEYAKMKWNLSCIDNPDKYGVDLIAYKNDVIVGYIEVESRLWKTGKFCEYNTIHIPHRKEKLFKNNLKTLIFVTTFDYTHGYWTNLNNVKESPVIELPNKAVQENEWFFDVPIKKWKLVDLTELF